MSDEATNAPLGAGAVSGASGAPTQKPTSSDVMAALYRASMDRQKALNASYGEVREFAMPPDIGADVPGGGAV